MPAKLILHTHCLAHPQVRHRIHNWEVDVSHNYNNEKPQLWLNKRFKHASLGVGYDLGNSVVSLKGNLHGLGVQANVGRQEEGWGKPSLQLTLEPITFL